VRLNCPNVQSERRESNPRSQLGKLMYCLCTTLAGATHLWAPMLAGPHQSCQRSRSARTNPTPPRKVAEKLRQKRQRTVCHESKALHPRSYAKRRGPLGKRPLNVYSHCRSGNPPPAPKSGSEIRRSICSADGAPRGAIGVLGIVTVCGTPRANSAEMLLRRVPMQPTFILASPRPCVCPACLTGAARHRLMGHETGALLRIPVISRSCACKRRSANNSAPQRKDAAMLQRYAVTFNKPSLAPLIFAPDPPLRLDEQTRRASPIGCRTVNSRP
jgi:hypothetical protein